MLSDAGGGGAAPGTVRVPVAGRLPVISPEMNRRRILWLAVPAALLLILGVLGFVGVRSVRTRIASGLAALPVPVHYADLSLRIAPLRLRLHGASVPDGAVGSLSRVRAETVTATADLSAAVRLLRGGVSAATLRRAVRSVTILDLSAERASPAEGSPRSDSGPGLSLSTERVTVRGLAPGEVVTVVLQGAEGSVRGVGGAARAGSGTGGAGSGTGGAGSGTGGAQPAAPSSDAVAPDPDAAAPPPPADPTPAAPAREESAGRGRTIAARIEAALAQAVALRDGLPAVQLTLEDGTMTVDDEEMQLRGAVESAPGGTLVLRVRVAEAPLAAVAAVAGAGGVQAEAATTQPGSADAQPGSADVESGLGAPAPEGVSGRASGTLEVAVLSGTKARLTGAFETDDLVIRNESLAERPLGPLSLRYDFDGEIDTQAAFPAAEMARRVPGTEVPAPLGAGAPEDRGLRGAFTVTRGALQVGEVSARFEPVLQGLNAPQGELPFAAPARLDFELELVEAPLGDIVNALPPAVLGPLAGIRLGGTLSWNIALEAPIRRLSWTRWEERNRLDDFTLEEVDPAYDVRNLAGAFRHRIRAADTGYRRDVLIPPWEGESPQVYMARWEQVPVLGPTPPNAQPDPTYRYVPYQAIAPSFIGAVVTAEDGEFFRHNGVNWLALTFALEVNLARGEVVTGGSTIPMQLAKNVFLDDRRVVVRKLQELALVAIANVSEAVTRERILEIYLNVIEFGPDVYGIADASAHYFGRSPAQLSVPQSVWLASIIRSPRVLSQHARAGAVPPVWLERMAGMMEIMVERERLTAAELEAARGVQPEFRLR